MKYLRLIILNEMFLIAPEVGSTSSEVLSVVSKGQSCPFSVCMREDHIQVPTKSVSEQGALEIKCTLFSVRIKTSFCKDSVKLDVKESFLAEFLIRGFKRGSVWIL